MGFFFKLYFLTLPLLFNITVWACHVKWDSHDSAYGRAYGSGLLQQKKTEQNQQRFRKSTWGKVWGKPDKLPRTLSQWSYIGCASFPQQGVTTSVKCCQPRSWIETQYPGCLVGEGVGVTAGSPCLARIRIPDSKKESGVQHKWYCLYKHFTWAHQLMASALLKSVSWCQTRVYLASRPLKIK